MCKEYSGFQSFCDEQMFRELTAVICSDGSDFTDIREQHDYTSKYPPCLSQAVYANSKAAEPSRPRDQESSSGRHPSF